VDTLDDEDDDSDELDELISHGGSMFCSSITYPAFSDKTAKLHITVIPLSDKNPFTLP